MHNKYYDLSRERTRETYLLKQQIHSLEKEKKELQEQMYASQTRQPAEHERLVAAARRVVEMVDPQEEGMSSTKSLVERLEEAPHKILSFLFDNTRLYIAHVLALVKSYWPQAKLAPLASGVAVDFLEEDFIQIRMNPVGLPCLG